jgi:hypothetical protein
MSDLDESVKDSVDKLLGYKENESIRYRGRNWVQVLGDELFDGKSPEKYFLDAYVTRNNLAHGNVGRPTAESLKEQIPELRRYLLALLGVLLIVARRQLKGTRRELQRSRQDNPRRRRRLGAAPFAVRTAWQTAVR